MASLNKVQLIGNAGRDPEVRYLPSGQAVTNVSIATTIRRKDKQSGETVEDTSWHRLVFYDRLAEVAGEYIKKGRSVYVEGRIKYGTYTDKTTGVEKNTVDIVVSELQLLGGRDSAGEGAPAQTQQTQQTQRRAAAPASSAPKGGFEDMDDDIPF